MPWGWDRLVAPGLLLIGLAAWEWAAQSRQISALLFPAPTTVAAALTRLLVKDALLLDVAVTLYRAGLGLAIGGSIGVFLGLLMGWSGRVRTIAEPFVAGLHPVPDDLHIDGAFFHLEARSGGGLNQ